jgi:hypothetical protein
MQSFIAFFAMSGSRAVKHRISPTDSISALNPANSTPNPRKIFAAFLQVIMGEKRTINMEAYAANARRS